MSENKNIIADTLLNYNKSGIMELTRGNYQEALHFFKRSYFVEKEMKLLKEQGKTLVNIANTEMLLNEPEEALKSSQEALDIFNHLHANKEYISTLLFMGTIYLFLKDIKKGENLLHEVIRKSTSDDIKGEAYYSLHHIYIENKNNYKAQDSITRSIQYFERNKKDDNKGL